MFVKTKCHTVLITGRRGKLQKAKAIIDELYGTQLLNIRILGHFSSEYKRTFPNSFSYGDIHDILFDEERIPYLQVDIMDNKPFVDIFNVLNERLDELALVVMICSFLSCTTLNGVAGMPVFTNGKCMLHPTHSPLILIFDEAGLKKPLLSDLIRGQHHKQIMAIIMLAKSKNNIPQLIQEMVNCHFEL